MAPGRKKPAITLSKVPSVRELCDRLGFQRASSRQTNAFTDALHAFRKNYKTSNGTPGPDLIDWNAADIQQDLHLMAMKFLDETGMGSRFWSESRSWKEDGDLHYPEDRAIIADLLKQLCWKQNKYSLNNQNYAEKKSIESRDESIDTTTPTPSRESAPTYRSLQALPRASIETTATLQSVQQPRGPIISLLDEERDEVLNQIQNAMSSNTESGRSDIFEVPIDPGDRDKADSARNKHSLADDPPPKAPNNYSSPQANTKKRSSDAPPPKRTKVSPSTKSKTVKMTNLDSPRRRSDRARHTVIPSGQTDQVEAVLDEYERQQAAEHRMHEEQQDAEDEMLAARDLEHENDGAIVEPRSPTLSRTLFDVPRQTTSRGSNNSKPSLFNRLPLFATSSRTEPENQDTNHYGHSSLSNGVEKRRNFVAPIASMTHKTLSRDRYHLPSVPSNTNLSALSRLRNITEANAKAATPGEPTTKPKPKVRGIFKIVTSRKPKYSEISWRNGQIREKTLGAMIDEIASLTHRNGIEELSIKLETSMSSTTHEVQKDDEVLWELTKANLKRMVHEAFLEDKDYGNTFQIWFEPVYNESVPMGNDEDVDYIEGM